MFLIGSYALVHLGHVPANSVRIVDLVGVEADVARIRAALGAALAGETRELAHRHVFRLAEGQMVERIILDLERSASDRMLPALCTQSANVLGLDVLVPPVEVLFLIERACANVPLYFGRAVANLLLLKPLLGPIGAEQQTFYDLRKQECRERYKLHRQRFKLSLDNADFFDASSDIRFYEHDDLHRAVAHTPGHPLFERCKRDLSLARIDVDLFVQLSPEDRLRMVREEFMVIGIERFHLREGPLGPADCYARGMNKTIRDLFVGYFQDFCIDHIEELQTPPPHDFIRCFEDALARGEIGVVEAPKGRPNGKHKRIWSLIEQGDLATARRMAEDMVRMADFGVDPQALFLLGVTLRRGHRPKEALDCLGKALRHDHANALAWFEVGAALVALGGHAKALTALRQAQALGLRTDALYWQLGQALEGATRTREAIAAYRRTYELTPDYPAIVQKLQSLGAAAGPSA